MPWYTHVDFDTLWRRWDSNKLHGKYSNVLLRNQLYRSAGIAEPLFELRAVSGFRRKRLKLTIYLRCVTCQKSGDLKIWIPKRQIFYATLYVGEFRSCKVWSSSCWVSSVEGPYCLSLQGSRFFLDSLRLKMNAVRSAETSATTHPPTLRHNPEDLNPLKHRCENLKSRKPYLNTGYRYRGPGFDPRRYQIFWVVVGLERGPLSLVRSIEELLEWKK